MHFLGSEFVTYWGSYVLQCILSFVNSSCGFRCVNFSYIKCLLVHSVVRAFYSTDESRRTLNNVINIFLLNSLWSWTDLSLISVLFFWSEFLEKWNQWCFQINSLCVFTSSNNVVLSSRPMTLTNSVHCRTPIHTCITSCPFVLHSQTSTLV